VVRPSDRLIFREGQFRAKVMLARKARKQGIMDSDYSESVSRIIHLWDPVSKGMIERPVPFHSTEQHIVLVYQIRPWRFIPHQNGIAEKASYTDSSRIWASRRAGIM
jgi:hypothetical protein